MTTLRLFPSRFAFLWAVCSYRNGRCFLVENLPAHVAQRRYDQHRVDRAQEMRS